MSVRAALGFTPHSGWAAAVAVRLEAGRPSIVYRGRIEMADAQLKGSKQPYHTVAPLPLPEARRRLAHLSASATRKAQKGLGTILESLSTSGASPRIAGILDASGRTGKELADVLGSHALIHAADGEHFRTALQRACEENALAVARVKKRELVARATDALELSTDELLGIVRQAGKPVGPPWGADQKSAALLAWLLLVPDPKR